MQTVSVEEHGFTNMHKVLKPYLFLQKCLHMASWSKAQENIVIWGILTQRLVSLKDVACWISETHNTDLSFPSHMCDILLKLDDVTCRLGFQWEWEFAASEKWSQILKTQQTGLLTLEKLLHPRVVRCVVGISELSLTLRSLRTSVSWVVQTTCFLCPAFYHRIKD